MRTIQYGPLSIDLGVFEVGVLDGRVVIRHKNLLKELDGEGALAHAAVTHHHQLISGQVVPRHSARRHGDCYTWSHTHISTLDENERRSDEP